MKRPLWFKNQSKLHAGALEIAELERRVALTVIQREAIQKTFHDLLKLTMPPKGTSDADHT